MRIPSFFLSHGAPDIVLQDSPAHDFFKHLPRLMPRPNAIVIASAHFEESGACVVSDPNPETIHDFGGFALELYKMKYRAPGSPELAERVSGLLQNAGIENSLAPRRGFDHGVWTPLLLAFPEADIPVVQVSIDPQKDAAYHHGLGSALACLRDEGVLVIGSGHITHNLGAIFHAMKTGGNVDEKLAEKVGAFTGWFEKKFAENDREAILNWKIEAPHVAENHPSDEHLMPIFFAYGAGGEAPSVKLEHNSWQHGIFAYQCYSFD